MTKRKIVCPYKSTNRNKCTHKKAGDDCVFNNPINCPIFQKVIDRLDKELKDDSKASECLRTL